uniref:BTB domain-containing protein n=1 Tax=Oryza meridionalis TaxID=40149 RepID=A0A0E0F7S9_9ORYZ
MASNSSATRDDNDAAGDGSEPSRPLVAVPPPDMHRHLGSLLSGGHGADITLQVGDETFAAHRCVLAARSPVFMAELFGPMSQNNKETIRVHDMEPRVFEAMLHFIYNDSLPKVDDDEVVAMAQHLLVAADRYGMERLKLICEDTLCSHVDASTAGTTLTRRRWQHHCDGLKEACFKFMADPGNPKVVMKTDGYLHLTRSCSYVLKKLASVLKKTCTSYGRLLFSEEVAAAIDGYSKEVAEAVEVGDGEAGHEMKVEVKVAVGDARNMVDKLGADVLVMGSHGYGLFKRALLGSVSDYCVRNANCPVLIVK